MTIFGREPVLVYNFVAAVIALVVSFGLQLTPDQIGAILLVTLAALSVVVRSQVTPTRAPALTAGTTVTVVQPGSTPNTSTVL